MSLDHQIKKRQRINTAIILALSFVFLIWVGLRILFPIFSYSENAVKYTGRPEVLVVAHQLADKNFLSVAPFLDYNFDKFKLKIKGRSEIAEEVTTAPIWKGYLFQFYPQGKVIETEAELADFLVTADSAGEERKIRNGSLIEYNGAVYFVSKGKARPFIDPAVFNKLGFGWEKVKNVSGHHFNELEKGEPIDFNSPHPSGTMIKSKKDYFLVYEKTLHRISAPVWLENEQKDFSVIENKSLAPEKIGHCQRQFGWGQNFVCKFKAIQDTGLVEGDSYLFEVPPSLVEGKIKSQITLSVARELNWKSIKQSLAVIKNSLYLRYHEYIL